MKLSFNALYEPLEIEIGDKSTTVYIDLTANNALEIGAKCKVAGDRMKSIVQLRDKAKSSNDFNKFKELNNKLAEVMEDPIKAAIGEESYNEILALCGNGRPVKKAAANIVMFQVMGEISRLMTEQRDAVQAVNEKAAHYLAEVQDAQAEPDTAE